MSASPLSALWHSFVEYPCKPWQVAVEDLEGLVKAYPDRVEDATESVKAFYFSSFQVPCIAVISLYIVFVLSIFLCATKTLWEPLCPVRLKRFCHTHLLEAPLISEKHHEPLQTRSLEVRLPLRGQTLIIAGLVVFNVGLLIGPYHIVPGERNIFYHGEHAIRNQMLRYIGDRSSLLCIGQLPLVILTAGRSFPLPFFLTSIDYGTAMLYHRWMARMVWLQVNIHALAWTLIVLGRDGGWLRMFRKAYWLWGCFAIAMMWGLTLLSIREVRRRNYELFIAGHVALAIGGCIASYLHISLISTGRFRLFALVTKMSGMVWALDRVFRLFNRLEHIFAAWRSRTAAGTSGSLLLRATLQDLPGGIVKMRIALPADRVYVWGDEPKRRGGQIAAGHSVRVLIPQVQAWSDHPFTVVSTGRLTAEGVATGRESDSVKEEEFLELLIKQEGGFTKELSELARKTSLDVEAAQVRRITDVGVILEGPYGHVYEDRTFDRCQEARLYAGGIGVTFSLPMISRLVRRKAKVTACRLIWSVRDLALVQAVEDYLVELSQDLAMSPSPARRVDIDVHLTAPCSKGDAIQDDDDAHPQIDEETALLHVHGPHCTVMAERCSRLSTGSFRSGQVGQGADDEIEGDGPLAELGARLTSQSNGKLRLRVHTGRPSLRLPGRSGTPPSRSSNNTLLVGVCGPAALCDAVRREVTAARRRSDREVYFVEECFDW